MGKFQQRDVKADHVDVVAGNGAVFRQGEDVANAADRFRPAVAQTCQETQVADFELRAGFRMKKAMRGRQNKVRSDQRRRTERRTGIQPPDGAPFGCFVRTGHRAKPTKRALALDLRQTLSRRDGGTKNTQQLDGGNNSSQLSAPLSFAVWS